MFRILLVTLTAVVFSSSLLALDERAVVRRDTEIPVEVHTSLKSGSAKVGQVVEFRTVEAVLIGNNIVVPAGARILGTVIEVRNRVQEPPRSLIRIRIQKLRWKRGEAVLNALVTSVRRPHSDIPEMSSRLPTFMEGIRIVSHVRHEAYTDFFSDEKNFTIRSGVSLMLRQIDPDEYGNRDLNLARNTARTIGH